jgi:hypothetical protein
MKRGVGARIKCGHDALGATARPRLRKSEAPSSAKGTATAGRRKAPASSALARGTHVPAFPALLAREKRFILHDKCHEKGQDEFEHRGRVDDEWRDGAALM